MTTTARVFKTIPPAFLALLFGAWPATSTAQPSLLRTEFTQTFSPLVGGTAVTFSNYDEDSSLVPIGFSFEYFGQSYDYVNVGTNGGLVPALPCVATSTVGTGCPNNLTCAPTNVCVAQLGRPTPNQTFPQPGAQGPVIAALWDDLLTSPGQVTYQTEGSAPNREFIVQWSQVQRAPISASHATFQIRLQETVDAIEIHYGAFNYDPLEVGAWQATMGIQDSGGNAGDRALPCALGRNCNGNDLNILTDRLIHWAIPQTPELVARGPSRNTQVSSALPGGNISVSFAIENIGTTATGTTVDYEIRLVGPATHTITQGVLPSIDSGTTITALPTLALPAVPPGYYDIDVVVDPSNRIPEVSVSNNTEVLRRNFVLGTELFGTIGASATANPGGFIDFVVSISNAGAGHPRVPVKIYLSSSPTTITSTTPVADLTFAIGSTNRVIQIRAPVQPRPAGTYFAVLSIDPDRVLPEALRSNDLAIASVGTQMLGPDLTITAVSTPNLIAAEGEPLQIDATIENLGNGGAIDFTVQTYFSDNRYCGGRRHPMPPDGITMQMDALDTLNIRRTYIVPPGILPGTYYLCVSANPGQVMPEVDTSNNHRPALRTIEVYARLTDFSVVGLRTPNLVAAGEPIALSRTIVNYGQLEGTAEYQVYLSADDSLDPAQDCLLETWGTAEIGVCQVGGISSRFLGPREESAEVERVVIPASLAPGQYHIIYRLDPNQRYTEVNESNNILVYGPITMLPAGLHITTDALPRAITGAPYEARLRSVGHSNTPSFRLTEGTLPAGILLSDSGLLSGIPVEPGDFDLTFEVFDGAAAARANLQLKVIDATTELQIVTRSLPTALVGTPIDVPLVAIGGTPPYSWHVLTGTTPPGLTLHAEGWLRGTVSAADLQTLEIEVEDAFLVKVQAQIVVRAVNADGSVRWSNTVLPDGRVDEPYAHDLQPQPETGIAPFTYDFVAGTLPPGLDFEGACERLVCGTPTASGEYIFDLRISDAIGYFDVNRYIVNITNLGFRFATASLPDAVVGEPYRMQVSTVGSATVSFTIRSGDLPAGLQMTSDGSIHGLATDPGLSTFVVIANTHGQYDLRSFALEVVQAGALPPPVLRPEPEDQGCRCTGSPSSHSAGLILIGLFLIILRKRRVSALLILLLCTATTAQAQPSYGVQRQSQPYVHLQDNALLQFSPDQDNGDVLVDLPFVFPFYGTDYTQITVGTNGLITMGSRGASAYNNSAIPVSRSPNAMIAPWWDDLVATRTSTHTTGRRPNRTFVIQYAALTKAGTPSAGQIQFQVRLFEQKLGRFDVHYGPFAGSTGAQVDYTASSGFEDGTGTNGQPLINCPNPICDQTYLSRFSHWVMRVRPALGPDVVAVDVVGPAGLIAAEVTPVAVVLESFSEIPTNALQYTIHLLAGGQTPSVASAVYQAPISFGPYERRTLNINVPVPRSMAAGTYTFAVVVDSADQIAEHDEANNTVLAENQTRVRAAAPNFKAHSVDTGPEADVGGGIDIAFEIENTGTVSASTAWKIVLSNNRVLSAGDRHLTMGSELLQAGQGRRNLQTFAYIPAGLPPGRYWLGIILDPLDSVSELDELNNSAISAQITIFDGTVRVDGRSPPQGYLGIDYLFDLTAAGGNGDYAWSLVDSELPAGLTLQADQIVGVPQEAGTTAVTFDVLSDGQAAQIEHVFTITEPVDALTIVTRNLQPGLVGSPYPLAESPPQKIVAVGAHGPARFLIEESGLASTSGGCADGGLTAEGPPLGLSLDPDGKLHGTPQQAGHFELLVVATDDRDQSSRCVALTVGAAGRLTLVVDTLPPARICDPYAFKLQAIGSSTTAAATLFSVLAPPPPGIKMFADGTIQGTPTTLGRTHFVVQVDDGRDTDTGNFWLEVRECSAAQVTPARLNEAQVGEFYEIELDAPGLGPLRSWSLTGDAFPTGLSAYPIEQRGRYHIEGVPMVGGVFTFSAHVQDAAGRVAIEGYTLVVNKAAPLTAAEGCRCTTPSGGRAAWLILGLLVFARRRLKT